MPRLFTLLLLFVFLLAACDSKKDEVVKEDQELIRINQIGYYPKASKKAVVINIDAEDFELLEAGSNKSVYSAKLSEILTWDLAGEKVRIADFSEFDTPGSYILHVPGFGKSYPFDIKPHVLSDALKGSIKALYYQRASSALPEQYAGKWHRKHGHPDDSILFHPSSGRTEGYTSSPKGWYDAGDYNKYVVNGSFPLGQLFLLASQYPQLTDNISTNIPDNNELLNPYLEELKYEMDWLLTMQDDDGGLYHKLTTKRFENMVMPDEAVNQRYMVGRSTSASLDFAACAALAYRIFVELDSSYAQKCLTAAERAWKWSDQNPDVAYENPEDVSTGAYGDKDFVDERYWAACELFISTKDAGYLEYLLNNTPSYTFKSNESWTSFMRYNGMINLLNNPEGVPNNIIEDIKSNLIQESDILVDRINTNDYFQPVQRFVWGSNSDVANAAIIIAQAYRINGDEKYLQAVQESVDYILGKNAVGRSFLTGFGHRTPMFIHHRQSAADGIEEPVPGLLSGGPNKDQQDVADGTIYPENVPPMKSWVDQESSYASNEICLNWNAPLTYILGFLEAESK